MQLQHQFKKYSFDNLILERVSFKIMFILLYQYYQYENIQLKASNVKKAYKLSYRDISNNKI